MVRITWEEGRQRYDSTPWGRGIALQDGDSEVVTLKVRERAKRASQVADLQFKEQEHIPQSVELPVHL
jgi:hypothetical protein